MYGRTLLLSLLGLMAAVATAQDKPTQAELQRRREQLVALARRGDELRAMRAVQELLILRDREGVVGRAILGIIATRFAEPEKVFNSFLGPAPYVSAVAELGQPVVPQILEALESDDTPESVSFVFLACLGEMGPKAKDAIPRLRRKMADPRMAAALRSCYRLVIANLGDRAAQRTVIKELEKWYCWGDVGDVDAWSKEEEETKLLRWNLVIHWFRLGDWSKDVIVKRLRPHFAAYTESRPGGESVWTWLSSCVEAVKYADKAVLSKELEAAQRHAIEKDRAEAIGLSLALARVDPEKREVALRRLCVHWPVGESFFNGKAFLGWLILLEFVPRLIDAEIAGQLVQLMEDPDKKVAQNAAEVLEYAGLSACAAVPQLLALMKRSKDPRRRKVIAAVLRSVANFSQLQQIEDALERETDEAVRKELDEVVRRIRAAW